MSETDSTVVYKDIPGFPGYRAGSDGSIWSCIKRNGHKPGIIGTTWMKLKTKFRGYCSITIRGTTCLIHRLILETFVGPCPLGMQACHFPDPTTTNNALSNLRWGTGSSNQFDRIIHGTDIRGEKHHKAKLTESDVRTIRDTYKSGGTSHRALAKKYGVAIFQIGQVLRRKSWKHVA